MRPIPLRPSFAIAPVVFALLACQPDGPSPVDPDGALSPTARGGAATTATTSRPIEEFVAAQGDFCFPYPDGRPGCLLFVPPVQNYLGWFAGDHFAAVDYAGLANEWLTAAGVPSLGTEFSGSVTVRPLADGRALVHVVLRTTNALVFAPLTGDYGSSPLVFGTRASDVLAGATPALGTSYLQVRFIIASPDAPLPDLLQLLIFPEPGQETLQLKFHATAVGPMHAAADVPEGTLGRLTVQQIGIFNASGRGALADGFPAERIELHPIGP